jgi:hypothetical protein
MGYGRNFTVMTNEEQQRRSLEEAFRIFRGPRSTPDPYEWELAEYFCKGYLTLSEALDLLAERSAHLGKAAAPFLPRSLRLDTEVKKKGLC